MIFYIVIFNNENLTLAIVEKFKNLYVYETKITLKMIR
jgi:hypothetical protein